MIKIVNAKWVNDANELVDREVLISHGKIAGFGEKVDADVQAEVIDARGMLLAPSFLDVHVHLREPGFEYKETIATGSRAAAKGGYTTIFAMPNTNPIMDNAELLQKYNDKAEQDSLINTRFYSAITHGESGEKLVDFKAQLKAGAVAFSDDGRGVQDAGMMYDAMLEAKKVGSMIVAHCEENSLLRGGYIHEGNYSKENGHKGIVSLCEDLQIARDCAISLQTGTRYHICHMSTAAGTELLRYYRSKCNWISGEVTPHHLLLTEEDLKEHGDFKMNPPLRSKADREALIKAFADGTISCIATDHAPHSQDEKERGLAGSPFGIIGLETAFPLLYTHLVLTGKVTLRRLIEGMTEMPAKIFDTKGHKIEIGQEASLVLIDLEREYTIRKEDIISKSTNTPFDGYRVKGFVDTVLFKGRTILKGGQIIE